MATVGELYISGRFEEARRLAASIGDAEAFVARLRARRLVEGAPEYPGNNFPI